MMKLDIKELDYKKIREEMDVATAKVGLAERFDEIKDAFRIYNAAYIELSSLYSRLFLKMYHDVSDQETMVQLASNVEYLNELVHYAPFGEAVTASPYYDDIIACYGKPAISLLKFNMECNNAQKAQGTLPPSIDEATMKYQNLVVQANGNYRQFADEFDSILQEVVETNHKLAQYYGYENYCDYANLVYSRFDYGEDDIMKLCEQVRKVIVPYYEKFKLTYSEQLKQKKPAGKDLCAGMADYTKRLGKEAAEYWASLSKADALDIEASPVKMPGMALQRFIEEERLAPIILNPAGSFNDGWMLAHEFGHSFQEYLAFNNQELALNEIASADVMEISSRLLELFLHVHAPALYEEPEKFVTFHLDSVLRSIIAFAMSTEYEHWLYHNVDATKQERKEKYFALYRETRPSGTESDEKLLNRLYDETTVFTMPKYQFCYVLAWINAMQIAKDYKEYPEKTYKKFLDLSTNLAFYTYNDLVEKFELCNVFEEGSVDKFLEWFEILAAEI